MKRNRINKTIVNKDVIKPGDIVLCSGKLCSVVNIDDPCFQIELVVDLKEETIIHGTGIVLNNEGYKPIGIGRYWVFPGLEKECILIERRRGKKATIEHFKQLAKQLYEIQYGSRN